jgi:hypothetical protein
MVNIIILCYMHVVDSRLGGISPAHAAQPSAYYMQHSGDWVWSGGPYVCASVCAHEMRNPPLQVFFFAGEHPRRNYSAVCVCVYGGEIA